MLILLFIHIFEFLVSASLYCSSATKRDIILDITAEYCTKTNIDFVGALQMDNANPCPLEDEHISVQSRRQTSQLSLPISTFTALAVSLIEWEEPRIHKSTRV